MEINEYLRKFQKKIKYKKSDEYRLISKYKTHEFSDVFDLYCKKSEEPFALILGFALICAHRNKFFIENNLIKFKNDPKYSNKVYLIDKLIKEELANISYPYFKKNNSLYFVPLFPYDENYIFSVTPHNLYDDKYKHLISKDYKNSIINMFQEYNFDLFDSNFTRLVCIERKKDIGIFYHPTFRILFIINKKGELVESFYLFDKYLRKICTNHAVEKLKTISSIYFSSSKADFIKALVDNQLVSEKLISKVKKRDPQSI